MNELTFLWFWKFGVVATGHSASADGGATRTRYPAQEFIIAIWIIYFMARVFVMFAGFAFHKQPPNPNYYDRVPWPAH